MGAWILLYWQGDLGLHEERLGIKFECKWITLFCKKCLHSLYSQCAPNLQVLVFLQFGLERCSSSLCYLPSLQAWRKGSHDKSIRNTLILVSSIIWKQKFYILFPRPSGMSCSIWAPSAGRHENEEGKQWAHLGPDICPSSEEWETMPKMS